ncbi:ABC transporter ATP-binding protein [Paenibacillus sp. FSL P4-0338]|uniref:ABC transporter ATP-binding protein n=1 Tax=unclassified Paenibacillus TaxID=185978 RepID=UPI0003E2BBBC|nr:ABC transporter ATP-binding protein [Paenibacillus sp. FSL R7-269]ETT54275.1 ABC transporter ATP-binding protein [Paenibacillus sp. FSL R7-269]
MLEINQVNKQYNKGRFALMDINLQLRPGIIGLLGPNGAGKSTLMKIMATISQPTSGKVIWNGMSMQKKPDQLRKMLGYLPQDFGVYSHLNSLEFLEYVAVLKGMGGRQMRSRVLEILQLLNLQHDLKRPLRSFSGGMRQRIGIAQALLNDPQLLILDEPTVGLDPEERMHFRSLINGLSEGRIIVLSTHVISDVEAVADQIAILTGGKLAVYSDPAALLVKVQGKVWSVLVSNENYQKEHAGWLISAAIRQEEGILVRMISESRPFVHAVDVPPSLEEAYLYVRAMQEESIT